MITEEQIKQASPENAVSQLLRGLDRFFASTFPHWTPLADEDSFNLQELELDEESGERPPTMKRVRTTLSWGEPGSFLECKLEIQSHEEVVFWMPRWFHLTFFSSEGDIVVTFKVAPYLFRPDGSWDEKVRFMPANASSLEVFTKCLRNLLK